MPTIRTAADRILATVAALGGVKDGTYGPYQSVLFESPSLPEGKVWRSMQPEQAQQFTKGQQAYLVPTTNKQGKPSWDIELLEGLGESSQSQPVAVAPVAPRLAPAAAPPAAGELTPEQKRAIAAYVEARAPLLKFCYQHASAAMPDGSEVEIAAGAAALFEAACRRFEL
jgi:hypothetical protein